METRAYKTGRAVAKSLNVIIPYLLGAIVIYYSLTFVWSRIRRLRCWSRICPPCCDTGGYRVAGMDEPAVEWANLVADASKPPPPPPRVFMPSKGIGQPPSGMVVPYDEEEGSAEEGSAAEEFDGFGDEEQEAASDDDADEEEESESEDDESESGEEESGEESEEDEEEEQSAREARGSEPRARSTAMHDVELWGQTVSAVVDPPPLLRV